MSEAFSPARMVEGVCSGHRRLSHPYCLGLRGWCRSRIGRGAIDPESGGDFFERRTVVMVVSLRNRCLFVGRGGSAVNRVFFVLKFSEQLPPVVASFLFFFIYFCIDPLERR